MIPMGLIYPLPVHPTWNIVDPSKMQTFMSCRRKFFYEYVVGWRSDAPNNHLHFGTAVHKALEHLYKKGFDTNSVIEACDIGINTYRQLFPSDSDVLYGAKTPDNLIKAVAKYSKHFERDLEDHEVLYLETSGAVPISEDRVMYVRMDGILQNRRSGMIDGIEHKTGSREWLWEDQWPKKMQINTYHHVLYCLYYDQLENVRGMRVNGLIFLKRKKDPVVILEVPVRKTPDHMAAWLSEANFWYSEIEQDFNKLSKCTDSDSVLDAFHCNGERCLDWGRVCEYQQFCLAWANPLRRIGTLPNGFKKEYWDPRDYETTHTIDLTQE